MGKLINAFHAFIIAPFFLFVAWFLYNDKKMVPFIPLQTSVDSTFATLLPFIFLILAIIVFLYHMFSLMG